MKNRPPPAKRNRQKAGTESSAKARPERDSARGRKPDAVASSKSTPTFRGDRRDSAQAPRKPPRAGEAPARREAPRRPDADTPRPRGRPDADAARPRGRPDDAATRPRGRPDDAATSGRPREDIVAGRHAVKAVLEGQPTRSKRLHVASATENDPVIAAAANAGIKILRSDKGTLDLLAPGLLHQGYVLEVGPYPYVDLEDAIAEGVKLALVLDEVEDPRNLGAAARAAYALGADLLVIPERRAAKVTASAEKTAAGALAKLRVARPGNLRRALQRLKEDGMWIVGGDNRTDLAPWNVPLGDRVVIIVGAEEYGMRRLTREACDHVVSIPMAAAGMSLNAADAATVLLYEAARQRSAPNVAGPGAGS